MVAYLPRVLDEELTGALRRSGAVLIEGPKACGKTSTAMQRSKTVVRLDDARDQRVRNALAIDPTLLLEGTAPILLDEWQQAPQLWDMVRHEVDDRQQAGQFILTGSATPDEGARRHSGAGRFAVLNMRTMSLAESGESSAQVSLSGLIAGEKVLAQNADWSARTALIAIANRIVRGGWPGYLGLSTPDAASQVRSYLRLIAEHDIDRVSPGGRYPTTVMKVMRSLARVVANPAKEATIAKDARGEIGETGPDATSRPTVAAHLDALSRLRIVEDQPAWSPQVRSARRMRQSPKRHFADPSLAAAALNLDVPALLEDLETLGFLFESQAVHDLRVYSQPLESQVFYYRDDRGLEADAIIELPGGEWGAIEVKLGAAPEVTDEAAAHLLHVADQVNGNAPKFLAIINNGGIAYTRPDGVHVVPLTMLGP